ncbi:MAG: AAA family ATPase [Desulfovibrio sp.]|nr:AAA family ATPase [Desulfovibrio sp.]
MYIKSLQIDRYGLYRNVSLDDIPRGLCIFLGDNEAGKSTCVDFIRSILTGFPDSGRLVPGKGEEVGGRLLLSLDSGEELLLGRSAKKNEKNLLFENSHGDPLPPARLHELLTGISRESYTRIFGFSLNELERAVTLDDVQDALTGATFGMGLNDPQAVLASLKERMEALYRIEDTRSAIPVLMEAWIRESTSISQRMEKNAGFDAKALQKKSLQEELRELSLSEQDLQEQLRLLERRLDAWQQWDEWRALGLKLDELPGAGDPFPEHGAARIEELVREERQRAYAAARQEEKENDLRSQRDALNPDLLLLMELPLLRRLGENKTNYREALARLAPQQANCRRLAKELEETLARLGSDWSCERIHQTDLSLFTHNALESTAIDLRAAQSAHESAVATLEQINHEQELADEALHAAEKAYDELPNSLAPLEDSERDDLRHTLARIEEAQRQLPEKNQNIQAAKAAFQRSWDALKIPTKPDTDQVGLLDTLLLEQHKVRELATTVEQCLKDSSEAEKQIQQLEDQIASVTSRMEALRQAHQDDVPDRNVLDEQAVAVRRLRDLLQMQEHDKADAANLEQELLNEGSPTGSKKISLIVLGSLLSVTGVGMILANVLLHITAFTFLSSLTVPINLWSGYLTLLAGVLSIWGGSPHDGEDLKRRKVERQRKEERLESARKKIAKQDEEITRLSDIVKLQSPDMVTLDAVEVRITRDREYCIRSEHYQNGMVQLKQEMESLATLRDRAKESARNKSDNVQQARLAWHECLEALGIQQIPDAAQAGTFLTRVEMTRMSFENVNQAERALNTLNEELSSLLAHVSSFAPVALLLLNLPEEIDENRINSLPSILNAANEVLANCREADKLREHRASMKAKEAACTEASERVARRREEAGLAMKKAEERFNLITVRWQQRLQEIGLDQKLNPQTAAEALKCMQDCLALEATLANAHDVLSQTEADVNVFQEPLEGVLSRTKRSGVCHADSSVDWLATFDTLLEAAHEADRLSQERDLLSSRVKEEEKELAMCRAELETAREEIRLLLDQAACADTEAFLVKSRQHEEYMATEQRRRDLEAGLKSIAGQEEFAEFLKGFEREDRASQERRQDEIKLQLEQLEKKKTGMMREIAALEVSIEDILADTTLPSSLQKKALLEADIREKAFEWGRLAIAFAILQRARDDFEKERQPAILKTASEIFQRITAGAWRGIVLSLENRTLSMLRKDGEDAVAPDVLSRGTQEQAYLALRLAYIVGHAAFAESLPLLMDEVLVNFDTKRALCTAQELARMANGGNGKPHQIFYFTCHPETVDILRSHDNDAALFHVEGGTIRKAG